jgi:membrane protease YdiL (CAAX protease family)
LPVLLTALAFGLLHAVDPILALLSFAAGLGWSAAFAWRPNLLVVGTPHGLVGGVFFYFAAGKDVLRSVL